MSGFHESRDLQPLELLVEGLQGLFEHASVRGSRCAAQIRSRTGACHLNCTSLLASQPFGMCRRGNTSMSARCLFLLSFDCFGFPASGHVLSIRQ
jgi:hypothetical protein